MFPFPMGWSQIIKHRYPMGVREQKVKFTLPPPRRASRKHTVLGSHQAT